VTSGTLVACTVSDGRTGIEARARSFFPSAAPGFRAPRSRQCPCHAAQRARERKTRM